MGRRERAKADKRARILAAARTLLAQNGFDRMTMAQVADDADVAVGTVFQYASTKAELLMMVVADQYADSIPAALAGSRRKGTPTAVVRRALEPLVATAIADPEVSMAIGRELLFGAEGPHRADVLELVATLEQAIASTLDEQAGTEQAAVAARLIVSGALLELNRTRTGRATRASIDRRLAQLVDLVAAGATAGAGPGA